MTLKMWALGLVIKWGKKIFSKRVMSGIKISVFLCRFQKYKLVLVTKFTERKLFQKNRFWAEKSFLKPGFSGITFLMCFCY
jgi:hypothetical protein